MRKLIILSALPACLILGICAQIVSLSFDRPEPAAVPGTFSRDPKGYYYPAENFPLVFHNVSLIDLTSADLHVDAGSSDTLTPIPPTGYLITENDVFKFLTVSVEGDRVSFTTEERIGVSYQFTGRVFEGDYPIHGIVAKRTLLDGRLVKYLLGFKIAVREVRFYQGDAC